MEYEIHPLKPAEVPKKGRPPGAIGQIRERHHSIAKLVAAGLKLSEVGRVVGMTGAGVKAWADNPANAELTAQYAETYQNRVDAMIDVRLGLMNEIAVLATAQMRDQLIQDIEAGNTIPYDKLVRLGAHVDDRTGLGRQETKVNVNMDLGSRLDRALQVKRDVDQARAEGNVVKFIRRLPEG